MPQQNGTGNPPKPVTQPFRHDPTGKTSLESQP